MLHSAPLVDIWRQPRWMQNFASGSQLQAHTSVPSSAVMFFCSGFSVVFFSILACISLLTAVLYCFSRSYGGLSGRVVSASDCGVRGPRFESYRGRLCLPRRSLRYTALGTGCAVCTFTAVPKSTQPSTLRGTVE